MKKNWLIFLAAAAVLASCDETAALSNIEYVDPFIGTGFHGHTYPGATTPFGAVQLSPDTHTGDWDACSGYHYDDSTIIGFSHTHLSGTGCADLADILFRPVSKVSPDGQYAPIPFSHQNEKAHPGYYSVNLPAEKVKVELTAAPHTGVHRYSFEKGTDNAVLIDLLHSLAPEEKILAYSLEQTAPDEVRGMKISDGFTLGQQIYFTARFSRPISDFSFLSDSLRALVSFEPDAAPLIAKVGLSLVSTDNAAMNMDAEVPDFDFEAAEKAAYDMWDRQLSVINVDGCTMRQRTIFYTALYHACVVPNLTSDVNGDFRRNDGSVGHTDSRFYSTFSLWDTFRSWLPLMMLINPDLVCDMVNSMLDMYHVTGTLPIWPLSCGETNCMIGYHSIPFIVEAYLGGLMPGLDIKDALEAMMVSSDNNSKGSSFYVKDGYIPANFKRESVSCLLEFAYDDWCISQFAKKIGNDEVAARYEERARSYIAVFDGNTGFFRGKNSDGTWSEPFAPLDPGRDFTEANAWQYRFFTPHDFAGLSALYGGDDKLVAALDEMFETVSDASTKQADITGLIGQYAHGNEPSHHISYVYSFLGKPWRTQYWTRRLLDEMYQETPEGIVGNEDCGQMSAWYVNTALGLYEVCPGSGQYILTSPIFRRATVHLGNGSVLEMSANHPRKNGYVESVTLNGRAIDRPYLSYSELAAGGMLTFCLASEAVQEALAGGRPYSLTSEPMVSVPYYDTDRMPYLFDGEIQFSLGCRTEGAVIHYTLDGSEPDGNSPVYSSPFTLKATTTVRAIACKEGMQTSRELKVTAKKAAFGHKPMSSVPKVQGVNYDYYEGDFQSVNEIKAKGRFVKSGKLEDISLSPAELNDFYGIIYSGYVFIPETGIWEFGTVSDDGSVLVIDGEKVVDNDGGHSAVLATARIPLQKGYYPYQLLYFEGYEGEEIHWCWKAPSAGKFEAIPAGNLFTK